MRTNVSMRSSRWLANLLLSGLLSSASVLADSQAAGETMLPAPTNPVRLQKGPLAIAVDTRVGGRITELSFDNHNLLTPAGGDNNNFGSTFWLSPQTLWNWPPVVEHDSAPYQLTARDDDSLHLQGNPGAGARVSKSVSVLGDHHARVSYRVTAEKHFEEVAAWEITRVPSRGIAFAPVNTDSVEIVRGSMKYLQDASGVLWLPMQDGTQHQEGKLIANGREGWLGYAADNMLYLKVYPTVSEEQMASGEGDIELYLSGVKPYLELEVQSAAQALPPGAALDWSVDWLLFRIPKDVEVQSGSTSLLAFVREQVAARTR